MTAAETASLPLRVAGVVPAAGASRRMGRTKALLTVEGETFTARVVSALMGGGCDPVIVVTSGDAAVADEARRRGGRVLVNDDPGEGPITSLRLALAALSGDIDGVAYLPIDFPMVSSQTVATLLAESERSGASLTIPQHRGKRGHPAIFRRELFGELGDPTLEGGARTVVHRHLESACIVEIGEPTVVTDVDTPEAYAAITKSTQGSL